MYDFHAFCQGLSGATWVRSFRNDLLDYVIVLSESHFKRLARDYLRHYHADRTQDGLDKEPPAERPKSIRNPDERLSSPRRAPPSLFLGKGCVSDTHAFLGNVQLRDRGLSV